MWNETSRVFRRARACLRRRIAGFRHWHHERAYWRSAMKGWYRKTYGLEPAPIQDDDANAPPASLVVKVQPRARAKPAVFVASGQRLVMSYLRELADHGFDPRRFERILDFGVGFGRLIVHYYPFSAELHGCDLTGSAVEFTRRRHGARVAVVHNAAVPPLPYDDASFDYVYANSVFTHIQCDLMPAWIEELARVTKPGACVIVSVFCASRYMSHLSEREFDRIASGTGYLEFGSSHVRQRLLFAVTDVHRRWWGNHFEFLERRSHFKDQDHLIMRRRG